MYEAGGSDHGNPALARAGLSDMGAAVTINPMQTLLMIEDDTRLAQMVGEYLGQSGFTFHHAANGQAGLAQLQSDAPGALP